MKRPAGIVVPVLPLAFVLGSAAAASAVILIMTLTTLTLFAVVGLTFISYAEVRAVPVPTADVPACDIVISILDERGNVLDSREARVPSGETISLRYQSRAERGTTEAIRATIRSRTARPVPLPPGPCPLLGSLQVVDGSTGRTEAMMMPASQEIVRETIPRP